MCIRDRLGVFGWLVKEDETAKLQTELEELKRELATNEEVSKQGPFPKEQEYRQARAEYVRAVRAMNENIEAKAQLETDDAYSVLPASEKFITDLPTQDKLEAIVKRIFPAVRGVNFVASLHGAGPALRQSKAAAGNTSHSAEVAGKANRAEMLVTISLSKKFDPENTHLSLIHI